MIGLLIIITGANVDSIPEDIPAISALTVHQPHAWSIGHAGCRIINRDWRPPPYVAGQMIAIHAGKRWSRSEKINASALACQLHPQITVPLGAEGYKLGMVIAVARVIGFVDRDLRPERGPYTFDTKTSLGYVCVGGRFNEKELNDIVNSPWFKGPCAWLLSDIQSLEEPIEVRGFQKLWRLPGPAALALATQVNIT